MARAPTTMMIDAPAEAPKDCDLCPRLRQFILDQRVKEPDWFNGAVPSFGDPEAELLVIGLAPGLLKKKMLSSLRTLGRGAKF